METQPLAPGVPYDPGRRQVFGQMDNHDNHTLAAPDAPRKESRTKGYVRFMELTVDEEMWDALVPYMEGVTLEKVRVHHSKDGAKISGTTGSRSWNFLVYIWQATSRIKMSLPRPSKN